MALMTMIARVVDGLPLVDTMQDDEQSGRSVLEYQNQAKLLFRKLGVHSPPRCSIETGPYLFHYLIENGVCYLVLCDKIYSKRLAFNYLEDLAQEFHQSYRRRVNTVTRPYAFIEFDVYIQKAKKNLTDRRSKIQNNIELQDVEEIVVQNIDDVLQRGSVLSVADVVDGPRVPTDQNNEINLVTDAIENENEDEEENENAREDGNDDDELPPSTGSIVIPLILFSISIALLFLMLAIAARNPDDPGSLTRMYDFYIWLMETIIDYFIQLSS